MIKLLIPVMLISATSLFVSSAETEQCDISGLWAHANKPAQLFIHLERGEISVHSHNENPESIGLVVLKSLKIDRNAPYWHAEMFNASDNNFVDVQITPLSCQQLSITFQGNEILGLIR